jgi:zinc/manganese transport system permease protein
MTSELAVVWPAMAAGLIVALTHVPLGIQVLSRGIVFIDLAVAQIAGLGVVFAHWLGFEAQGYGVQLAALCAALAGALLLGFTERLWPDVQEAVIGVVFVLAANAAILLLASNPHGAEHLKDLLTGQVLWVNPAWLPIAAVISVALWVAWAAFRERIGRTGFYLLFAIAVTISVQLVGVYLVFATLIIPALAARRLQRRVLWSYVLAAGAYGLGLALSLTTDLPAGPLIVCSMAAGGVALFLAAGARAS